MFLQDTTPSNFHSAPPSPPHYIYKCTCTRDDSPTHMQFDNIHDILYMYLSQGKTKYSEEYWQGIKFGGWAPNQHCKNITGF